MHVSAPVYCEPKLQEPRQHPPPYKNIWFDMSFAPLLRQRWRMVLSGCLGFASEQQGKACTPYAAHAKPLALEFWNGKCQQQAHLEFILSESGLHCRVLDTLVSLSYICLGMVARLPFVLKFITLSRYTFLRAIWRTTRRTAKCTKKTSLQTPGNKVS